MKGAAIDATVVIPTFNRRDALLQTLERLAAMDYPRDRWEAVVVDDGSTEDIEGAVAEWAGATGAPVRCLRKQNAGPAAARNLGAREARGEVLVFIDNDILVEPDFLREHLQTLCANPGCWIVGRILHPPELRATPFGRYRDRLWESFYESHGDRGLVEMDGLSAANLSLWAADFHRLGGFDEDFTIASGEDWELAARARQAGIQMLYHPGLVVLHNDWAVTLDRFCERQRLYSVSDVLLWQKHGEASIRTAVVKENGPINWQADGALVVVRKLLKGALSLAPARRAVLAASAALERLAPDSRWSHRAYEAAISLSIFRGVRDGFRRYRPRSSGLGSRTQSDHAEAR